MFDRFMDTRLDRLQIFLLTVPSTITGLTHTLTFMLAFSCTAINTGRILTSPLTSRFSMHTGVFGAICKYKILDTVIIFYMILMMDNFIGQKITSKVLLHYKTMFFNFSKMSLWVIRLINMHIAVRVFSPAAFPMVVLGSAISLSKTFTRAKFLRMRFVIPKYFATILASITSLPKVIVTITITKTSLLARGSVKIFSTRLTDIFHINKYNTSNVLRIV